MARWWRRWANWGRDERGNMAVEFAMVAPVLTTLTLGMADFGIAEIETSRLRSAARAGLQAVLLDNTDTAGAETIAQELEPDAEVDVAAACSCSDTGVTVACAGSCATGNVARVVTVTLTKDVELIFPWPGLSNPMTLTGTASARVQ